MRKPKKEDDKDIKMIRILKNNSWGKMLLGICWSGSSRLHLLGQKSNCSSHIVTPLKFYGCALWRNSYQNSIRKLTVSFNDTLKRLINVPRYTSSSLAFATNSTDCINVVFRKFAYSLMSRVTASPNSIVSAVVNSDDYHQSPLSTVRQVGEYDLCLGIIIDRIISQYVNVWWTTLLLINKRVAYDHRTLTHYN